MANATRIATFDRYTCAICGAEPAEQAVGRPVPMGPACVARLARAVVAIRERRARLAGEVPRG